MVTLTKHIRMNILQREYFSAMKHAVSYEKYVSLHVIPNYESFKNIIKKKNKTNKQTENHWQLPDTFGGMLLYFPSSHIFAVDSILNGREKIWSNLLD